MIKALRDNLTLLALLITLVGISSTEGYYAFFGLKYQFIDLPTSHILYRGLTTVFLNPLLIGLYLAAIIVLAGQSRIALAIGHRRWLHWLNYALIVVLTFVAWFMGSQAGFVGARIDATEGKTTLPLLSELKIASGSTADEVFGAVDGVRLLLHERNGIYVLNPVSDPVKETPLVKLIASGDYDGYTICVDC